MTAPPVKRRSRLRERRSSGPLNSAPMSATARGRLRGRPPRWSLLVVALLFVGPVLAHEPVFGDGSGAIAAGTGVAVGLVIAAAATIRRWDVLSTLAAVLASHFLLGGAVALPTTTLFRVVPSADTLQTLVLGSVQSWKDLLTITPPASSYVEPALVPWISGLVCATLAGLLTARWGRAVLGSVPIIVMGLIGVGFGPAGTRPTLWPVVLWWAALLLWWAFAAQRRRIDSGEDIVVGRRTLVATGTVTDGPSRATVHVGRRIVAALVIAAVGAGIGLVATVAGGPWNSRIVGRDLVEPPLDVREYPSPLSAYRHYSTDLEETTLIAVSGLPEDARVRVGVMDVYDGTTFGMSGAETYENGGYLPVGTDIPDRAVSEAADKATMTVTTSNLSGPWVPLIGIPEVLAFAGDDASAQQSGLHVDLWADAALTTGPAGNMKYALEAAVEPQWSDGQLSGVSAVAYTGGDIDVPDGVAGLAASIAAKEQSALGKARAIERYLSEEGFYLNDNSSVSRPGHRADRLQRMIESEQLIGDDEQYAALMALMLHSLGINARVVMGAYSEGASGDVELRGADMHVWVEVEFEGVGWAVFDPTPPRDQTPQTEIPEPRSVPRPQVLQPPEPPEEPVELPPTTSDKAAETEDEQIGRLPWGLIAGISGGLILLIAPIVTILLLKTLRRRRRRLGDDARTVLVGSWDEVVDLAIDAGYPVEANRTRQEAAWELAGLWPPPGGSADAGSEDADASSVTAQGQTEAIPGWTLFAEAVPTTVAVARRADVADFAEEGASRAEAELAWNDVEDLRSRLRNEGGPAARIHRALSLKSLRARWARERAAKKTAKEIRRAEAAERDRVPSATTPTRRSR